MSKANKNLEVNYSATFYNRWHTHSWGFLGCYSQDVLAYMGSTLYCGNSYVGGDWGSSDTGAEKPRLGDEEYAFLGDGGSMKLSLDTSTVYYDNGNKKCACGGANISKQVVAFRDARAPEIASVGGNLRNGKFKVGDTITLELKFNEPIRFADDTNKHDDLYVLLRSEGAVGGGVQLYLTKLENETLYFTGTVGSAYEGKNVTIASVDLSPLIHQDADIKLVQVLESGRFELTKLPADVGGNAKGFNKTTSYITDLAGNPLALREYTELAYIDGEAPHVSAVQRSAFTHNDDVKEALGKTNPLALDYLDKSDLYLGSGDSIRFTVALNEQLVLKDDSGNPQYSGEYKKIRAVTNLSKAGVAVELTAPYIRMADAASGSDGLGASKGRVTTLIFWDSISITSDMTCDDPDNKIKLTRLIFENPVTDLCGNAIQELTLSGANPDGAGTGAATDVNQNPLYLDVTPPTVNTYGSDYTPVITDAATKSFCFPITVADSASGANGVYGSFRWKKTDWKDKSYSFQYGVGLSTNPEEVQTWSDGKMGVTYRFQQAETQQYIHIRLPEKNVEAYSLLSSVLEVWAQDLAGNSSAVASYPLNWFRDDLPPTIQAGKVTRVLNPDGTGTLTVNVKLSDQIALKNAWYLWTDPAADKPDDALVSTPVTSTSGISGASAQVSAMETVADGDNFHKRLWLKAEDSSSNVYTYDLDTYCYDLTGVDYTLEYSANITSRPSLKVTSLEAGAALLAMVKVPITATENPEKKDDLFYVRYIGSDSAVRDVFQIGAITQCSSWRLCQVQRTGSEYTVSIYQHSGQPTSGYSFGYNTFLDQLGFIGELDVTVLAGLQAAFTAGAETYSLTTGAFLDKVGSTYPVRREDIRLLVCSKQGDTQPFQLTVSSSDPRLTYLVPAYHLPDSGEEVLTTLEGVTFQVDIGEAYQGLTWLYDDIDYASSKLVLTRYEAQGASGEPVIFEFPLGPGRSQTVTIPANDYAPGAYIAAVKLQLFSGKVQQTFMETEHAITHETVPDSFFVDTTPVSSNFGMNSLRSAIWSGYDPQYYGLSGDDRECYSDNDILYFPVSKSDFNMCFTLEMRDLPTASTITSGTDGTHSAEGVYEIFAWNLTAEMTQENGVSYNPAALGVGETGEIRLIVKPTVEEAKQYLASDPAYRYRTIPLVADQENVLAVQVLNGNGRASIIKYYTIYPVTKQVQGTLSMTAGLEGGNVLSGGELIFTPAPGQSMDGVRVYAKLGTAADADPAEEQTPQADGTWTLPLPVKDGDEPEYFVSAVDAYLNATLIGTCSQAILDAAGPTITSQGVRFDGGTYTAAFRLEDVTFRAVDRSDEMVVLPPSLHMTFDETRCAFLGIPAGESLELTLDYSRWDLGRNSYQWLLGDETSPTGIYEVTAAYVNGGLDVQVTGALGYDSAKAEGALLADFTLNLEVTDALGFQSTAALPVSGGTNLRPAAVTENGVSGAPAFVGLELHFNTPVKAEPSWMNPSPIGYARVQTDAFAVTADGETEITFTDLFGHVWEQTLTLTDVFGDYGVQIDFSTLDLTGEAVSFSGRLTNPDKDTVLLLWKHDVEDGKQVIRTVDEDILGVSLPKKQKAYTTEDNLAFDFRVYDRTYTDEELYEQGKYNEADRIYVHISNIGKEAPEATPRFYFEASGREYALADVPAGETLGAVEGWYRTSRNVTSTGGTGERITFRAGGPTKHTFQYVDDLGFTGQLTVDLTALGVTLGTPPEPVKDENAPIVNVDIFAKRSGSYARAEAFTARSADAAALAQTAAAAASAFDSVGYVQGYSLKLNVQDESSFRILLLDAAPAALSYTASAGAQLDGVTLSGNTLTVTKPVRFWVAVVDNASGESAANADNATWFQVDGADMADWFDNTPPEAVTEVVATAMYERTGYVALKDQNDLGAETGSASLTLPQMTLETSGLYAGKYSWRFLENGTVQLFLRDGAGNQASAALTAAGINLNAPVLSVSWSPALLARAKDAATGDYLVDENGDPVMALYPQAPAEGPLNRNVTAIVTSDMPVETIEDTNYTLDRIAWYSKTDFEHQYPEFTDQAAVRLEGNRAVVTFQGGGLGVRLRFTAPNGKSSEQDVYLNGSVIDRTPPVLTVTQTPLYRAGVDPAGGGSPYAVEVSFQPNEPVYCAGLGESGTLYDSAHPLTVLATENETIAASFTDKAGNLTRQIAAVTGIDREPPQLTTDPDNTLQLPRTSGNAVVQLTCSEDCTVTYAGGSLSAAADTPTALTFTENGVYTVSAADAAGNSADLLVSVGNIDRVSPALQFTRHTVSLPQDAGADALADALEAGVVPWDNLPDPAWQYDSSLVRLDTVGLYPVTYTVTDAAGNSGSAVRYMRVYSKLLPLVLIDGERAEPDGTSAVSIGSHILAVRNLAAVAPGLQEPYTVKLRRGICTAGQMKYFPGTVPIGGDGGFTLTEQGFYTLYIVTQSRASYLTILYTGQ